MYKEYKEIFEDCWAVHSYGHVHHSHSDMLVAGCSFDAQETVNQWFPDTREAAFFRNAMRLLRIQVLDGELIEYQSLCTLFKKHIQLANDSHAAPN